MGGDLVGGRLGGRWPNWRAMSRPIRTTAGSVPVTGVAAGRGSTGSARCPALATVTSTAVTLYSGQFVAQSLFSVVTTLAPVTGWWNVV